MTTKLSRFTERVQGFRDLVWDTLEVVRFVAQQSPWFGEGESKWCRFCAIRKDLAHTETCTWVKANTLVDEWSDLR